MPDPNKTQDIEDFDTAFKRRLNGIPWSPFQPDEVVLEQISPQRLIRCEGISKKTVNEMAAWLKKSGCKIIKIHLSK